MNRVPAEPDLSGLITIEDAASILGVSGMTVRRMIDAGRLTRWRKFNRTLVSRPQVEQVKRERGKA